MEPPLIHSSAHRSARLARLGDEGLAQLVSRGSDRAFAALYARYHQPLYRYCRSILRHDADAQDALQSTFAAAFGALRDGRRNAPLRPWLFRIAHNQAVSLVRRRRSEIALPDTLAAPAGGTAERVEQRDRLERLWEDLRALPERQRAALLLRELSGLSHEEIAIALGGTVSAAKQTIFEARRSLADFEQGRAMSCDDVCRAVSGGDRRALRGRRLRAHLQTCPQCATFASAIPVRAADLRALSPALPPLAAAAVLARATQAGLSAGGGAGSGGGFGSGGATGATVAGAGGAGKAALGITVAKTAAAVALAATASAGVAAAVSSPGAVWSSLRAAPARLAEAAGVEPTTAVSRRAAAGGPGGAGPFSRHASGPTSGGYSARAVGRSHGGAPATANGQLPGRAPLAPGTAQTSKVRPASSSSAASGGGAAGRQGSGRGSGRGAAAVRSASGGNRRVAPPGAANSIGHGRPQQSHGGGRAQRNPGSGRSAGADHSAGRASAPGLGNGASPAGVLGSAAGQATGQAAGKATGHAAGQATGQAPPSAPRGGAPVTPPGQSAGK